MRDLKSNITASTVLAGDDYNAGDQLSSAIDLQGFNSVAVILEVGTITGTGTITPKLQESDDDSTYTDVATNEIVGELSALATGVGQKVSYNGIKRYLKLATTKAGTVTEATYGVLAVKGNPLEGAVE